MLLTPTRLLHSLSPSPSSRWAPSSARAVSFPVLAAAGKGFGELLKQRNSKGKEEETPISSVSAGRGFGSDAPNKINIASSEVKDDESTLDHDMETACPCGGGECKLVYSECCMPYHQGTAVVPDGLSLLKSRYSAFARGITGYVVRTTHPDNPDFGDNLVADVQATCDQLRFYKLEILEYEAINDQESTVSFRVVYGLKKETKNRKVLEEKSYFHREGDAWLFKDGEELSRGVQIDAMVPSATINTEPVLGRKMATGFQTKSSTRSRKA